MTDAPAGADTRPAPASGSMASVIGMWDMPWNKYLGGMHNKEILTAHQKEFTGLTAAIMHELFPGNVEYTATRWGTNCRLALEFKHTGV